jgi:hypothetical protein
MRLSEAGQRIEVSFGSGKGMRGKSLRRNSACVNRRLSLQKLPEATLKRRNVPCLAFPNYENAPSSFLERRHGPLVALDNLAEFWMPISRVRFWKPAIEAFLPGMLVPKTAMNEDCLLVRPAHDVWFAGKLPRVEAESVTEPMNQRADDQFWLHAVRADSPHVFGTMCTRNGISHQRQVWL